MADNRMYMRCKLCGKLLSLGKRLNGTRYSHSNYHGVTLDEQLDRFFADHHWCVYPAGDAGEDNFEIVYEYDEDFDEKYGEAEKVLGKGNVFAEYMPLAENVKAEPSPLPTQEEIEKRVKTAVDVAVSQLLAVLEETETYVRLVEQPLSDEMFKIRLPKSVDKDISDIIALANEKLKTASPEDAEYIKRQVEKAIEVFGGK